MHRMFGQFLRGLVLATFAATALGQGAPVTTSFSPTTDKILNPERGFMQFSTLTNPWEYANIRNQGQSIVYAGVVASSFRNAPLSTTFLNQIQAGFNAARTNGIKVKFRLAYNDDGGADAPKSVILGHIAQLAPLWQANKDVIFHMDAGFIGGWGEWHSSTNGNDTPANRAEILGAILDALPVDRTVGIRTPHFKREIFGGSQSSDTAVITVANAFNGSDLSRVGHLNDCFLSSPTDFGTYINPGGVWPISRELSYIGGESKYAACGGETCALHARNDSTAAINEMTTLHTDYLNIDYHPDVITKWKTQGGFDEIDRRLGYRFQLNSSALPSAVKPGGLLPVNVNLSNVGFGELFNPRNVEVVLRNNTTGAVVTAALAADPRFWSGGTTQNLATQLVLPNNLAEGMYTVALWMPDTEASLRSDVRYAIRFANTGVWEASTGFNVLTNSLSVSAAAPGPNFVGVTALAEAPNLANLVMAGDYNRDGAVDTADFTTWRDGLGGSVPTPYAGADGNGNSQIDTGDLAVWSANFGATLPASSAAATAVPEPTGWVLVLLAACVSRMGYPR